MVAAALKAAIYRSPEHAKTWPRWGPTAALLRFGARFLCTLVNRIVFDGELIRVEIDGRAGAGFSFEFSLALALSLGPLLFLAGLFLLTLRKTGARSW